MQKQIDIASAAEIIGVNLSIVLGWCDNHIINCQLAPDDYSDKTKYIIDERECEYISSLVHKYGARKAFLYYEKDRNGVILSQGFDDITNSKTSSEQKDNEKDSANNTTTPIISQENSDELIHYVLLARTIKNKINNYRSELILLENQYQDLKRFISSEI